VPRGVRAGTDAGRTRAAEGNSRRPIVCARNRTDPISGFAKNGDAPVFIDETGTSTKMARLRGRAARGGKMPGEHPSRSLEDDHVHRWPAAVRHNRTDGSRRGHERSGLQAYIATPLSSSRNNADGRFSSRPKGVPQTRRGGVTALARESAILPPVRCALPWRVWKDSESVK